MRTPSLQTRMILAGIAVVAVLVGALDAFVYLSLRDELEETLVEILDARLQLATELATGATAVELEARLTEMGVPAVVEFADGSRVLSEPVVRRFGEGPPASVATPPGPLASSSQQLDGGTRVTVFASRAGVRATLDRMLLLEIIGSAAALALSVVILARVSRVVLRPVDRLIEVATERAEGRTGKRMDPDRTDTELGRMAAAFDDMLDELETALEDATRSERDTRRFLADAAHQLRTPMAGIRASVETILRGPDSDERERLLDNLARESARAGRLIDSLLRVAQLDRGETIKPATVNLGALARREARRARELAPNLTIPVRIAGDPVWIRAEASSIREGLSNLIDNARRHAVERITVDVTAGLSRVAVRVCDDGPGLTDREAEQAFQRFVSLDGHGGSGLGLAIARGIAEQHDGRLDYEAPCFVMRLPLTDPPAGTAGSDSTAGPRQPTRTGPPSPESTEVGGRRA